jgi:hypothetical protein
MDDIERDRIDRYLYPRPPADVIGATARAGLRDPTNQMWSWSEGLHVEKPLRSGAATMQSPTATRGRCNYSTYTAPTEKPTVPASANVAAGFSGASRSSGRQPTTVSGGGEATWRNTFLEGSAMKAGETVRFQCGDCRVVFDLTFDPVRDAEIAAKLGEDSLDGVEPCVCPISGADELRSVHDFRTHIAATRPPDGA